MYLAQEVYDSIPCTYFPHEVASLLAKAGQDKSLKCYHIPIKHVE